MNKKVSLVGRKRISELGEAEGLAEKKAYLLQMQAEAIEPVEAMKEPVAALKTKSQKPGPFELEISVSECVKYLSKQYQQFSRKGKMPSLNERCDHVVALLHEILKQKESEGLSRGLSESENFQACQRFVDQICQDLSRQGVRLNRLKVVRLD